jgi:hypothetical protein
MAMRRTDATSDGGWKEGGPATNSNTYPLQINRTNERTIELTLCSRRASKPKASVVVAVVVMILMVGWVLGATTAGAEEGPHSDVRKIVSRFGSLCRRQREPGGSSSHNSRDDHATSTSTSRAGRGHGAAGSGQLEISRSPTYLRSVRLESSTPLKHENTKDPRLRCILCCFALAWVCSFDGGAAAEWCHVSVPAAGTTTTTTASRSARQRQR